MRVVRINAEKESPCGWGVYVDGVATCSRNPPPPQADVNSRTCLAYDVQACSSAWAEHAHCPKIRAKGGYGGSRRQ